MTDPTGSALRAAQFDQLRGTTQVVQRDEILLLLRHHVSVLAGLLEVQNAVPNRVLLGGGDGNSGLNRINQLVAMLPEPKSYGGDGGG